jgi:hypothetical protein
MPEQEKAWPAFEEAARDVAATRASFAGWRTEQSQHDPIERAQRSADALAGVSAALKRYGKALGPLTTVLTMARSGFGFLSRSERRRFIALRSDGEGGESADRRGEFGVLR